MASINPILWYVQRSFAYKYFIFLEAYGAKVCGWFEELTDPDERAIRERDAYEQVNYLLEKTWNKGEQFWIIFS